MIIDKKSQSAVEFIMIILFMFGIFMVFFAIFGSRMATSQEEKNREIAKNFASVIESELKLASGVKDGYMREILVPNTIDGNPYNIAILGNRELVINYFDYEQVIFLPDRIVGNISKGENIIRKVDGIVYIIPNSKTDKVACETGEDEGTCGLINCLDVFPFTTDDCCDQYRLCCGEYDTSCPS